MQNLEQIRACNALKAAARGPLAGQAGGEVAKKLPAYIRTNGLLATLAFAGEKGGRYAAACDAVAEHMQSIDLVRARKCDDLLNELCEGDSAKLRQVTTEAMAYLNYLRRFAKKE